MRSALFGLLFLPLLLGACQGYRADPPDLAAHDRSWAGRRADADGVGAYAASLERLNAEARAPFDPSDGIGLEEAEAIALLFNPELRMARLNARVPLLGAQQSGIAPDPQLSLDLLRIVESVSSPWILGTGLSFTIPLSGRLRTERLQAFAEADAARALAHAAERTVVMRLRHAWNRWTATAERVGLIEEHLKAIGGVLKIASAQRDANQIGAPQLRVLKLEEVRRVGERDLLRIQHERQRVALNRLLGLTPDAALELVPTFSPEGDVLEASAERAQLRAVNPDLALANARYLAAEKAYSHEVRKQYSDLQLGPAYANEDGDSQLGATSGVTLPLWNRNRRAIAESRAARDAAKGAYEARFEMLVGDLADARIDQRAATVRGAWLREQVAPMADTQLAELRTLGELGDMDVLILKDALTSVLETKLQILDVRLQRAQASARVHALIDPLLTPTVRPCPEGETR